MMRWILSWCIVCFAVCTAGFTSAAQAVETPIRVAFLAPSPMSIPFWNDYASFMSVAAESLGIELIVQDAEDRFEVVDNARNLVSGPVKIDYFVYIYQAQNSLDVLALAEASEVKSFVVNTDVVPQERILAGRPRGRYKHWIGHMFPDDTLAAYRLARRLLDRAAERGMAAHDGRFHVVGVGGNRDATASMFREAGLRDALKNSPDVVLDHFVLANWQRHTARKKTERLLYLFPDARIYWAANDNMALGVLDAMGRAGLSPGEDVLIGGMDWSPEGIDAIREGRMEASLGGHFMEGAWVLALIYDYHHGQDFANSTATLKSEMRLIDRGNLETYLPVLDRSNWDKIDFKRFTKTHNPDLEEYDFSPDAVVRELSRK